MGSGIIIASSTPTSSSRLQTPAAMPRTNVSPAAMAELKEEMTSTSEAIFRLRSVEC